MKWTVTASLLLFSATSAAQLPPEKQADLPVPPGTADRLLEATAGFLKDSYVFPERVPELEAKIRAREKGKGYLGLHSAQALLERLNKDIQADSHDRHLRVVYFHDAQPAEGQHPPAVAEAKDGESEDASQNFGFQRAELLEGNIGYLDIRFFPYAADAGDTAIAAMAFLAHTRALIVDLRDNHGGDPGTVALILSYFFGPEPVHLNDIYWRPDNSTGQFWTQPHVVGRPYKGEVYVLTGPGTFSAGEEFAYDLQALHRATIIGERTGGGAHPITIHRIDEHFSALIPSGRAINPVTHTDWDGDGVKPDVAVPMAQALAKAEALAREKAKKVSLAH
jgi:hypothetical protein